MAKPLIVRLNKGRLPPEVGKKAGNLRRLTDKGFRVPQSWVCTWEAYERYLQDDPVLIAELSNQLARIISGQQAYAVRSSANLEDDLNHSYAGQFKSQLNVRGPEQVLQAIWSIWSSVDSATVQSYQQSRSLAPEGVRMAVLIQEMVEPQLSGVAFSKNPMTGMDEVLVEAVRGPGTLLVQEGIDPLRWVNKWGTWLKQAQDSGIDPQIIQSIVEQTREISQEMDSDVDLEWVYDGSQVYWVQVRDITTISNLNIYSNRISREMLPGQVKPLIWSINTRLVNQAWVKLIEEAVGTTGIDPDSLSKAFYYRAYFNMGTFGKVFSSLGLPRESLEIMMGIVPVEVRKPRFRPPVKLILKSGRLVRFMADKLRFSRLIDRFLPQCSQVLETISHTGLDDLSPSQLFAQIDRIYAITSQVTYYNIVGPLLNSFYHSLLMRQLKRQGVDYKKLDLISDLAELKQYNPNHHLADLHASYLQLSEPERTRLTGEGPASLPESPQAESFRQQMEAFIAQFGHFSDSGNDFSSVPWREQPEIILELITQHQPGGQAGADRIKFEQLELGGVRGWLLQALYRRSRKYSLYREQISSQYTYSYGLFRPYYLALANRLVEQKSLASREEVFFLYAAEVRALLEDASLAEDYAQRIADRKTEMQASAEIPLPEIIYGDQPPPIHPTSSHKLVGTPTSRGYYSGPVRVIRGLSEFSKMQPGDVLVLPFSDVGWTPLFAKAGAVVADSGGMLSHSSIIAREYNIPAVVSVSGVMNLPDGVHVSVDGFKGEILIHAEPACDSQAEHSGA